MQYRDLGNSGLKVPVLSLGCATFGGTGPLFGAWGNSDIGEARRMIDICLEAGVNMFDTAEGYSGGASEEILGQALKGRRNSVIVATKVGLSSPADRMSRSGLLHAVEGCLRRLATDRIDLLQLHACDARASVDELLETFDHLIASGKVRHVGVSNYPGWQLMKALAAADANGYSRYCSHQVYYSLIGRNYEAELMPLGLDQKVSALIWSPLGWGRLTGKFRRGTPLPKVSRLHETAVFAPPVDDERLYRVIDALEDIARETGRTVPQVALNWLIQRPTVASVIIGARNEAQLRDNLGAVGWILTKSQMEVLDRASDFLPDYPHTMYWQPGPFAQLSPRPV